MSKLNGRLRAIEEKVNPPAALSRVHLGADGSIGLYDKRDRLVEDLGYTIWRIYGQGKPQPPIPPITPGPAGPETFEELIARVWRDEG